MSIWSAVVTIHTICGSVGAPASSAFAFTGCSAIPNAIAAAAVKVLRRLCVAVLDMSMFPFVVLLSFGRTTSLDTRSDLGAVTDVLARQARGVRARHGCLCAR